MAGAIGGSKTTSTGHVAAYMTRAGGRKSRGPGATGPVGGSKTTSTGRVALHIGSPAGAPSAYMTRRGR